MVNLMNSNFEERFNPPFTSFKSSTGGYVVRPLDWEGVWNPDGELVSGNAIVKCFDKEYADLIVDTFNRYFDLIKENKELKQSLINQNKLVELYKHRLDTANDFIESRKEHMIIDHYDDLKYIINECDIESSW